MNDFELMIDILKRGRANFEIFRRRSVDSILIYNDVNDVLRFTFDEFDNLISID